MKTIRIYRHPECPKCARIAKVHELFDWRDRIEVSTATPSTGPLRIGEVLVEEIATGRVYRGAEAFDLLCRNIPLYAPFRALLTLAPFRKYIAREMSGCTDGSCEIPRDQARGHGSAHRV